MHLQSINNENKTKSRQLLSHRPLSALMESKASTAEIHSRISRSFAQVEHVEENKHIHQDQNASLTNTDPAMTALWIRDVDAAQVRHEQARHLYYLTNDN